MSTLQVTTITTVNNTTPLILATGNTGGGQIILQATNNDIQFTGNMRLTANIVGDGSGLTLPTSNVANAAFGVANTALQNTSGSFNGSLAFPTNANLSIGLATNGRVIVTTPSGDGTVKVSGDGTNYAALVFNSSAYGWVGTTSGSNLPFHIFQNGSAKLTVNVGGYIGIGTTTPQSLLDITSSGDSVLSLTSAGTRRFQIKSLTGTPALTFYDEGASAERMRLTNSGYLGIGTTSPGAFLDVNGNNTIANTPISILARPSGGDGNFNLAASAGSGTTINSEFCRLGLKYGTANTNHNTGIGFYRGSDVTGGFMTFNVGAWTEAMRLNSSGYLGIQQNNPQKMLHVGSAGSATAYVGDLFLYDDGQAHVSSINSKSLFLNSASSLKLNAEVTGNIDMVVGGGSVGIGSANPQQKLEVVGLINSCDTAGQNRTYMGWKSGSSYGSETGLHLINIDNSSLLLGTNNTIKAKIDVNGNTSIGTTTTTYGKLAVVGTIAQVANAGTYTLDTTAGSVSVANGGTVAFPSCSGLMIVNNWSNGWVTMWLCGGGSVTNVGQVSGTVGSFAYTSGNAGYTWTNNTGGTVTVGFMFFRTRNTA